MTRFLSVFLCGCSLLTPTPPPQHARPTPEPHRLSKAQIEQFAEDMYALGDDAGSLEEDRAAFRQVCLKHQDNREIIIEGLHYHAQLHVILWRAWYEKNCVAPVMPDGTVVTWPEKGESFNPPVPFLCSSDAGAPPAQTYARTEEEILAQEQRLACERAQ